MLDSLAIARYDSGVAVVVYHPLVGDPFRIPPDDSLRLLGYNYTTPPSLVLDRRQIELPSEIEQYPEVIGNNLDAAKSESSFVTILLSGDADSTGGTVIARVAVDTVAPGANLHLKCIITEDSVADSMGLRYDDVARRFVPSLDGTAFSLARTDTLYDTLRFTGTGYNPLKLKAVVFVEDVNSGKVLQAAELRRFETK